MPWMQRGLVCARLGVVRVHELSALFHHSAWRGCCKLPVPPWHGDERDGVLRAMSSGIYFFWWGELHPVRCGERVDAIIAVSGFVSP